MTRGDNNQSKGRGWHGDSEGHARAGRHGGRSRSNQDSFFEEITSDEGQGSGNFQDDPEKAREAGRKGGRARNSGE